MARTEKAVVSKHFGIVVTPLVREESAEGTPAITTTQLQPIYVEANHCKTLPWVRSEIATKLLGKNIDVIRWPSFNRVLNNPAKGLFLKADVEHPDFGKVAFKRINGAVLVARIDGERIDEKYVEVLLSYLSSIGAEVTACARGRCMDEQKDDIKPMMNGYEAHGEVNDGVKAKTNGHEAEGVNGTEEDGAYEDGEEQWEDAKTEVEADEEVDEVAREAAKQAVAKQLTKTAFVKYFVKYKAEKVVAGVQGWAKLAEP